MDPPPNRIVEFCRNAPAPTVVRAKVRAASSNAKPPDVEVERTWGDRAPTNALADHFAGNVDDETLLVSLGHDGKVLGTSWPVFREQVSLELGIPDMKEDEAAALLRSPKCADELRAFRDRGVRPPAAEPTSTSGCAHCGLAAAAFDSASAGVLVVTALVIARMLRPSRSPARLRPRTRSTIRDVEDGRR